MNTHFKRLTAVGVLMALASPLSLFAESRNAQRTDLARMAEELRRVLGTEKVEVTGGSRPQQRSAPTVAHASSYEFPVVDAMNHERSKRGLPTLRLNAKLSAAARDRARDMFAKHYFDHVSPDGINPFSWVTREGYAYQTVAENLALGLGSGDEVVQEWMNSPGHRANLLGASYDEVGVAIVDGSPVRGYGTPLIVVLYGSR